MSVELKLQVIVNLVHQELYLTLTKLIAVSFLNRQVICLCALLFPSVSSAFFHFLLQFINYHSETCPAGKDRDETMNTCESCPAGTVSNSDKTDCGEFFL